MWFTAADTLPLFRNTIYAMNSTGAVRIVARVPGNTSLHDIAPDGRLLIARTDDRSGIAVRAPGETASAICRGTTDRISPTSPRRPSGALLRVRRRRRTACSVYLRGADGSLRYVSATGCAPLSPDGRWAISQILGSRHFDVIPTGAGQASRLERPGLTCSARDGFPTGATSWCARRGAGPAAAVRARRQRQRDCAE